MNGLLFEIRRSLVELDLGLKGDLSISEPMEGAHARALRRQGARDVGGARVAVDAPARRLAGRTCSSASGSSTPNGRPR